MQMGLRNLNLSGNKLTRLDVKRQTALETLDASGNALEEVSDMASEEKSSPSTCPTTGSPERDSTSSTIL